MAYSRSEQARLNGAKSRGPKTEAGKARSAMNATRHGLCAASFVVIDTEDDDAFKQLQQSFLDTFRPQNAIEHECVIQAAVARWRLRRVWSLETNLFNRTMHQVGEMRENVSGKALEAKAYGLMSDTLALLNRYERSISREYERALKNLDRARAERKYNPPVEEPAITEPRPEPSATAARNEPGVPEADGGNGRNEPRRPIVGTRSGENLPIPRAA
jgi:hypothetical protein